MTEETKRKIMIATYHTHKLFSTIVKIALVLFLAWVTFSMVEVIIYNVTAPLGAPTNFSGINLFELLMNT